MDKMKTGKLDPENLKQIILSNLGYTHSDVLVHARIGEDSSVIDFGDEVCVLSTDPITGASKQIAELALHISCNDIAANGAKPLGVQITLLFPENTTSEEIKEITEQLDKTASKMKIEILGGHTELTDKISEILINVTAVGKAKKDEYVTSSGAQPGDEIIITKTAGLEGTAIIAEDYENLLSQYGINRQIISRAQKYMDEISIIPEALTAAKNGAHAMHDITEGGVYGALYEIAEASDCGLEIWENSIPITRETKIICDSLDLNPLTLVSSGSLIITGCEESNIVDVLQDYNIQAQVIGKITEEERYIIDKENNSRPFSPHQRDSFWIFLDRMSRNEYETEC